MFVELAQDQLDDENIADDPTVSQIERMKASFYKVPNSWEKFKNFPYHDWDNLLYQNFMVKFL